MQFCRSETFQHSLNWAQIPYFVHLHHSHSPFKPLWQVEKMFFSCSVSPRSASFPSFYTSNNIAFIPSSISVSFRSVLLPSAFLTPLFLLFSWGVLGATVGNSASSWGSVPPLCSLQEHWPGRDPGTTHLHCLLHHFCSSAHHPWSHCLLATKPPLWLPGWLISISCTCFFISKLCVHQFWRCFFHALFDGTKACPETP